MKNIHNYRTSKIRELEENLTKAHKVSLRNHKPYNYADSLVVPLVDMGFFLETNIYLITQAVEAMTVYEKTQIDVPQDK